jgi:hypothetical protein
MREIYNKTIQLSPFDTYESRTSGYYSPYSHESAVYEHQQRTYYGNYGENQVEVVHLCVCKYLYLSSNHYIFFTYFPLHV